ncbi:MAG: DapH/DapD/GlmU-related protein [Pseudomonadota bacterium]|nr:DapH/DapD/GlmU-related protein [Pseudomonadota bacterium]
MNVLAFGIASKDQQGKVLEVFYPEIQTCPDTKLLSKLFPPAQRQQNCGYRELTSSETQDLFAGFTPTAKNCALACYLGADLPPRDVPSAYLKLHLLSMRLYQPNTLNLEGIFTIMPTVAWTSAGAISVAELKTALLAARQSVATSQGREHLQVYALDKFPPLLNYVLPAGVRIADSARVRLGAYLGEGTTVMPSGFINFNAGTIGPNMIEGRISQGLIIGAGTDVGGGASTMGTLSGGNAQIVAVGKDCLIGANAGIGISLGDNCIVEAGLYITAGAKVKLADGKIVKAREMAGKSNLLWRRNSSTGAVECLLNTKEFALNMQLHDNT